MSADLARGLLTGAGALLGSVATGTITAARRWGDGQVAQPRPRARPAALTIYRLGREDDDVPDAHGKRTSG